QARSSTRPPPPPHRRPAPPAVEVVAATVPPTLPALAKTSVPPPTSTTDSCRGRGPLSAAASESTTAVSYRRWLQSPAPDHSSSQSTHENRSARSIPFPQFATNQTR